MSSDAKGCWATRKPRSSILRCEAMADPVRLGIIGTSNWAEMLYFNSLSDYPTAVVSAICGRNKDRLADVASRFRIPHVFTDYRQLLSHAELDAVAVVVPDD